ncbi:phosphate regulon transcriptional regulator PhoB [Moraxella sp. VT-16-12]|uniref:phosphate regulon transcriptional regulator PhoB n=1 Tax=Moraxella sp. VT-16-12 TaxID=2014877 RepID=UPI0011B5903B|nr:phosphate regulon transcriptional regulator PhoB [Moraxella sp. VT-16-12]TWV80542.1 phosphate regulon transcriptional regulatory protein PhoB [Moraxella sp. VT-16-12]
MPKVLIVEDEVAIARLIEFGLEQAGFLVQMAESAEDAKMLINECLPDVVLLDWMLPKMSGMELLQILRQNKRTKDLPIVLLTARGEEKDKETGLNLGADDYVTKPFSPRELVARIKALLRRRTPHKSDDVITVGKITLNPAEHRVCVDGVAVYFSPMTFKLLHFFMTHTGRIYGRGELLNLVWGDHVFIEERTVDVHIRRLRRELEAVGVADYIQTVRGVGYGFGNVSC